MSNNGDVRDVTRVFNVTYKSRNIVNFALLEAHSLPKIGICLRIQAYVTLAILIPSKICQPNIISLVCQEVSMTIIPCVRNECITRVNDAMDKENCWCISRSILTFYSEHLIDIAICCRH